MSELSLIELPDDVKRALTGIDRGSLMEIVDMLNKLVSDKSKKKEILIILSGFLEGKRIDLIRTNLKGAKITDEQLSKVARLKGTIMPDGSIYS